MVEKHPELGPIFEKMKGPRYSKSLVDGEWIPTRKEYDLEMNRVDSNVGRYPVGFRHYENWQNYTFKYPNATMEDYRDDVNSQISFDEFLLLNQKSFLYECTMNPQVIYENDLHEIDSDDETDVLGKPEMII